jgi:hypothetical protein
LPRLAIEEILKARAQCKSEDFMLTLEDAQKIVHGSIGKMANRSLVHHDDALSDLGIFSAIDFQDLTGSIVGNLSSMSAKVEPEYLSALAPSVTVGALVDTLRLSARKLCSNPVDPHEQPCCPYPRICATCKSPVL